MIGKKLIKLLTALDPTEFRRMRKLFQSPIYTSNPHHLKLYDHLKKYYPRFESRQLEKGIVFAKIYDGKPFDDWKLRGLVTEFTRLTEEYFIMLDNQKKDFQRKRQLTKIYGERNLYDFFEKSTKNLLADLEASPYRDMHYYWHKAQLNEDWYFHPMKNKYNLKDDCLEDLMESLKRYLILGNRRMGITAKNVEQILTKEYDFELLKISEKDAGWIEENHLIQLYQQTYKLVTEQKEADFEIIETLLFKKLETLRFADKQLFFVNGLNFINRQINIGKAKYSSKAFEWNQLGLEHDLFLENQQMNENIFGNIVIIACREKQFDWAKDFIQSNQKYLDFKVRNDIANYNIGLLYFYQKEFDKAIEILQSRNFSSAYLLKTRLTLIRAAFEKFLLNPDYFTTLIYQIEAFEITLQRSKIIQISLKKPYLNTIRLIKRLATKMANRESKEKIEKWLKRQIDLKVNLFAKNWLLQKAKSGVSF